MVTSMQIVSTYRAWQSNRQGNWKGQIAMARLLLKSSDCLSQVIELRLGRNRFGRSPENDFQIEHPTVSATHCEIVVSEGEIVVRDCDSTNGTYLAGEPIKEAKLCAGQLLSLGDAEFLVENTEITISIPKFEVPAPAPPVVRADGSLLCPRHPHHRVTLQCTHCREVMCEACAHRLRRRGGKVLILCPVCSNRCEPIGGEKKKKKSFLELLRTTVRLPFVHNSKRVP